MAEPMRTFLGLTHNPFTRPGDAFYERAERSTCLEQLRRLSQWSRRVLLVSGPAGVGKSVLFRRLPGVVVEDARVVSIEGSLFATARELIAAIARGLGHQVDPETSPQGIVTRIATAIGAASDQPAHVVLVDDAHRLEHRAVDVLMNLAAHSPVRIVLFCEPGLREIVEAAAARHDVPWHEMRLAGFTDEHVVDYLEWRFKQARYRGRLPFTPEKVRAIAREASGLPGRVDTLASEALVDLEMRPKEAPAAHFPGLHRALALLLAAVAVLAWVLLGSGQRVPPSDDVTAAFSNDAPRAAPVAVEAAVGLPDASQQRSPGPAADEPPIAQAPGLIPPGEEPQAGAAPQGTAATGQPDARAPDPRPRDAKWLLAQPASGWTVQLLTVSSANGARAFIDRQADPGRYASYSMARGARTQHAGLWGMFATEGEARAAARALPPKLADLKPWVRPLDQIQANLR
jgi:type II secretory pathway predicted ATPase ExeA